MKTCRSCKHWQVLPNHTAGGVNRCAAPDVQTNDGKPYLSIDVGNPYEGADMNTGADFGCVLHEDTNRAA